MSRATVPSKVTLTASEAVYHRGVSRPFIIALCAVTSGCVNPATPVQRRFSIEARCPVEEVRVIPLGAGGYRATGCGQRASYVCVSSRSGMRVLCSREDPIASTSGSSRAGGSRVRIQRGHIDGVQALQLVFQDSLEMRLTYAPARYGERVVASVRGSDGAHCPTLELATSTGVALRGQPFRDTLPMFGFDRPGVLTLQSAPGVRIETCGQVLPLRPSELLTFHAFVGSVSEPGGGATDDSDARAQRHGSDDESRMRAMLTAARDLVLGCAGNDVVVVRATWAADGRVDIALQPPLAGTPEEACVRDALAQPRLDRPASAGTVIHALRR